VAPASNWAMVFLFFFLCFFSSFWDIKYLVQFSTIIEKFYTRKKKKKSKIFPISLSRNSKLLPGKIK
jgi:hypothetical protein